MSAGVMSKKKNGTVRERALVKSADETTTLPLGERSVQERNGTFMVNIPVVAGRHMNLTDSDTVEVFLDVEEKTLRLSRGGEENGD